MVSVTLTFSGAVAQRIQGALTEALGLEETATAEDYKAYLIEKTKQLVRSADRQRAERLAREGQIEEIDIT